MEVSKQIHVESYISRKASFSCAACQHDKGGEPEKQPGGFFLNLSEAEDHVRISHGVSEMSEVYESINLPENRQSLRPFKCKFCDTPTLFPSEKQLDEHISTHGSFFISKTNRFSRRVCRFCLDLLEEEKECSKSKCKSLIKSFAQEQSNSMSFIPLNRGYIEIQLAILVVFVAVFMYIFNLLHWALGIEH